MTCRYVDMDKSDVTFFFVGYQTHSCESFYLDQEHVKAQCIEYERCAHEPFYGIPVSIYSKFHSYFLSHMNLIPSYSSSAVRVLYSKQ